MKKVKSISVNYKLLARIPLLVFFLLFAASHVYAQDANSDEVKNHIQEHSSKGKLSPEQKKFAKEKKKKEKMAKKAEKAALKQHMKDQTPETRKRMKQDAREAKHNREHTREFFLKRWFTKKSPK